MPYSLNLPTFFTKAGWKVKVRDKERVETPHATIIRGVRAWRWDLRIGAMMDREPPAKDVPAGLLAILRRNRVELCAAWDKMYPLNVVGVEHE